MQPGAAQCPLVRNAQEASGVAAGQGWRGRGRPRPARPGHGSTAPAAGRCGGCHAAATWSSAPQPSRSTTRFSHGDTARARPLTATVAGMATSWRTGRQHLNQDCEHGRLQSVNDRTGRPIPHRRARPRHQVPLGRDLPTAPGQHSRSPALCNTLLKSQLRPAAPSAPLAVAATATPRSAAWSARPPPAARWSGCPGRPAGAAVR
jgi:hypothetical protein